MSLLSKNGCQYADGGFGDLNPILCARKWSLRDRCILEEK
jgi:hypothetical protein